MNHNPDAQSASLQDTVVNSKFSLSRDQQHLVDIQPKTLSPQRRRFKIILPLKVPKIPWAMVRTLIPRPVVDKVKDVHANTKSDFQNLADARKTPSQPAATGQPLTHYHSMLYSLLSWENPYATSISFVAILSFIFACRYLPALKFLFGTLYWTLGAIIVAEVAGKLILQQGLASSFRPKRYYTIPREVLESSLEDVEQLINFFVIEFQRVIFAENVTYTALACVTAFLSYYLIKIVPFWGLCLIGTTSLYITPLIYKTNQELIDQHLANAQEIVNQQTSQISDLASHHTKVASDAVKQYAGDYTAKAQEYIGTSSKRQGSGPINSSKPVAQGPSSTPASAPKLSESDFPRAPKQDLSSAPGAESHQAQYEKSQFGGQAVPAL